MTNTSQSTIEAILETFVTAQSVLPRNALTRARECWPEISPRLLIMLENAASGVRPIDRDRGILFFGVYLMAQLRETRALRPLCTLAADKERITAALDEDVIKDLDAIFVRICDSDPAPLQALIENADADEEIRYAALGALTVLTVTGRFDRDEFGRYLRKLHATMLPRGISLVWMSFQQAVALLGYDELVPLVEDVFARGWINETVVILEEFLEDFRAVKAADNPLAAYPAPPADPHCLDDITAYLSRWPRFRPKPDLPTFPSVAEMVRAKTVHNPYRNVGRNDPCPCGSGKKFKKCCLEKVG